MGVDIMGEALKPLNAAQMKQYYGTFYDESPKLVLNPDNVPKQFWPLLPYAEFWGLDEEAAREELIELAPVDVQQNLKKLVTANEDALEEWLAGPEADSRTPTDEYIAFGAMVMAADSIPWLT
jgi:hypothetical protein